VQPWWFRGTPAGQRGWRPLRAIVVGAAAPAYEAREGSSHSRPRMLVIIRHSGDGRNPEFRLPCRSSRSRTFGIRMNRQCLHAAGEGHLADRRAFGNDFAGERPHPLLRIVPLVLFQRGLEFFLGVLIQFVPSQSTLALGERRTPEPRSALAAAEIHRRAALL